VALHPRGDGSAAQGVDIQWNTLRPVAIPSEAPPVQAPPQEPPAQELASPQQETPAEPAVPPESAVPEHAVTGLAEATETPEPRAKSSGKASRKAHGSPAKSAPATATTRTKSTRPSKVHSGAPDTELRDRLGF